MTPETFATLLDEETRNAPAPGPDHVLAAGHRRLRRRRLTVAGIVLAAVVLGGSAAALAVPGPDRPHVVPAPADEIDELLETCRAAEQTANDPGAAVFGGADPVVTNHLSGPEPLATLEAPGGRYWAECRVGPGPAFVLAYDAETDESAPRPSTLTSPGCPPVGNDADLDCRTILLTLVTRLPEAVATVRFTTTDGQQYDAPTVRGYVVARHVFKIPDGVTYGELTAARPGDHAPSVTLTYLDASGTAIAGEDGALPPLSTYRVLGGWQHRF